MASSRRRKTRVRMAVVLGLSFLLAVLVSSTYVHAETKLTMTHFRGVETGMWVTDRWISEFEGQNPGIKLEIYHVPYGDLYDKVVVQFLGGKAADVVYAGPDQYSEFVGLGILEALDPYMQKDPEFDPSQSIIGPYIKIKGTSYMLGQEVGTHAFYYNTGLLGEHGLGAPSNWEELIQSAKKVMDPTKGIYGMTIPVHKGGLGYFIYSYFWPVLGAAGGDIIKDNKAAFNSEDGVKSLDFLLDLDRKKNIVSPGLLSMAHIQVRQRFANEQDVFMMDGVWGIVPLERMNPDLKYEVRRFFKGKTEPGAAVGGGGIGITTTSKNKEAAWKLLKYMGSKKTMMWAGVPALMPDRRDVLADPLYQNQPHWKPFIDSLVQSRLWTAWALPKLRELQIHFLMGAQKAYLDMETTQDALNEVAEKWNSSLAAGL